MPQLFVSEKKSKAGSADDLVQLCIDNCQDTLEICLRTMNYCLEEGGDHADSEHIRHLQTCAVTCRNAVELMAIDSDLAGDFCSLCAEACEACADSCDEMDDEVMHECAEYCRRSADSCRKMAHH